MLNLVTAQKLLDASQDDMNKPRVEIRRPDSWEHKNLLFSGQPTRWTVDGKHGFRTLADLLHHYGVTGYL